MNAGEVVVDATAVYADDRGEVGRHALEAATRQSERAREVAEVVRIAGRGNGIQQRRDRGWEVLVDIGVGPGDPPRCGCRFGCDRARLQQPDGTVASDRPFDILCGTEQLL